MKSDARPECIEQHRSIAGSTYYGIGGQARYFASPGSVAEIRSCLNWALQNKLPVAVLGCGSNLLFADGEFNGLVLCLSGMTNAYWETNNTLYVEAGVSNTEIAEICLDAGRAGAAWMYRMPGHLGATVRMNARCYGGEISQIAESVFTIDVHGCLHIYKGKDVFHGYKKTLLMDSPEIVVAARLKFPSTAAREELLEFMLTCEADRHRKHHFDHPSCGSTFKNNYQVGRPSGQVFDECSLKGTRKGQSEVSQFHANFVWNLGGASAHDMLSLAAHMRERALTLKNADLELEVQPIGLFDQQIYDGCAMNRLGPSIKDHSSQWVGLLWHANSTVQEPTVQWPKTLMQSPFHQYFRTPGAGQADVHVQLIQMISIEEAKMHPDKPFLRWETVRNSGTWSGIFPISPDHPPGFLDELWTSSVSELFIAHGNQNSGEYLEFEMTPEGHWIAIAFDAPRKRKAGHQIPKKELWPQLNWQVEENQMACDFPYKLLAPLLFKNELRVQACLSLGGEGWFLAPHWAPSESNECWDTQHKPDVKPDFHQPQRFWRVALD
ncbi:MAG: UDP-N-acetylmuramate dehydrogenase [Silvanigrellaceae bacterium]